MLERKQAVDLRLQGVSIAQVRAQTGLSAPTIIALHKAFLVGGWKAVEARAPGRPKGKAPAAKDKELIAELGALLPERAGSSTVRHLWDAPLLATWLCGKTEVNVNERGAQRKMKEWGWTPPNFLAGCKQENPGWIEGPYRQFIESARRDKLQILWCSDFTESDGKIILYAQTLKGELSWLPAPAGLSDTLYCEFMERLLASAPKGVAIVLQFAGSRYTPKLAAWLAQHSRMARMIAVPHDGTADDSGWSEPAQTITAKPEATRNTTLSAAATPAQTKPSIAPAIGQHGHNDGKPNMSLTHLQRLEAESIEIMREAVAEADNPVMLYSIGKDSAVMLRLALKAFYPAKLPFQLLHVDTKWKFRDMYALRDQMAQEHGFDLLVHVNPDGEAQGINPFTHGSQIHTDVMKTQGLRQALEKYGFDLAFGGARRDEEKSRAKERVFSFRSAQHRWDPKQQRPELWNMYNARKHKGESIRVFPISNWTELDIWQYIYLEDIPIVPLYFAKPRPVVERDGTLIMVDDDRMPLRDGEVPQMKSVRFRTLGCYPLTGAVESKAATLTDIIQEMLLTTTSERQGRMIDHDAAASMEKKKQEGYF